ncbi:MAG: formimidoylglutamate deiminase [Bacteroidota bacterium]
MNSHNLKYFQFQGLLQENGWLSPAFVGIDPSGNIQYLSNQAPKEPVAVEFVNGYALPGFQNTHSHAFQYAMAGTAEQHEPGSKDDFWSWREAMYGCALTMDPGQMEAVATMLYAEVLRKGYTHVAEFHYLHHDKDGKPYNNLAEMGERLVSAAATAGLKITLIPIFYQKGGFGSEPQPRQRRFISKTIDEYFHLLDDTATVVKDHDHALLGFGVHSLRAVEAGDIIKTLEQGPKGIPFHLHAAEQLKEVDDCLAHLKQRPIEWLLNHLPLNERFHLVHCTHMNDEEVSGLAKSGGNAVLCPGTEGNLGDGIFRLTDFARNGGNWSIGTDSHISLNPLEDLRWLDNAQRFTTHKRNTFDDGASILIRTTLYSGRKAMGISSNAFFETGMPLDAVVYDAHSPLLTHVNANHILPAILYTADSSAVLGTMVNGKWVVKDQQHLKQKSIRQTFTRVLHALKHS